MKRFKKILKVMALTAFSTMLLAACNNNGPAEHDHVWDNGEVTKEATCHSEGTRTFKCTVEGCNQTMEKSIAMTPHNWNEGTVTKAATCSSAGEKTYTCKNEGCNKTKVEEIEKLQHNYVETEYLVLPDLLEDGEMEEVCSLCGDKHAEKVDAHADFEEQFGLQDKWGFAYLADFVGTETSLNPTPLAKDGDSYKNEHVEVKKGHVKADGVALLAYRFNSDAEKIKVNSHIVVNGDDAETRLEGYLVLLNSSGEVKSAEKISGDSKDWTFDNAEGHELSLNKNDIVCVTLKGVGTGNNAGSVSVTFTAECVHVWNEGRVVKEPTVDEDGIKEIECIKCGEKVEQVIPKIIPEVDPLAEYFNFTGKLIDRFDEGVVGNKWVTDLGHTAHVEITTPGEHIYNGGMFVKTGVKMEAGKTYEVSFEASHLEGHDSDYEIILQNAQFDEARYKFFGSPVGEQKTKFTVTDENAGELWISFQLGNAVNEVTMTKLLIKEASNTPSEDGKVELIYDENVFPRFDKGTTALEGSASVDSDGKAHVKVTSAAGEGDAWRGGMFIKSGVTFEAGKSYTVSFDVERTEETDCIILLQNAQWEEKEYKRLGYSAKVDETIEVTAENAGELWIQVQIGNVVNEIIISNVVVKEAGDTPTPTPDPDPDPEPTPTPTPVPTTLGEAIDFTARLSGAYDTGKGVVGNNWVDANNSKVAHAEVTAVGENVWEAKVLINTGIKTEKDKTYDVNFSLATLTPLGEGDAFEFILQNGSADSSARYEFLNSPVGNTKATFAVTEENAGDLYVLIQMGKLQNELTISNLVVSEVEPTPTPDPDPDPDPEPTPDYVVFTNKLSGSYDSEKGTVGNNWVDANDATVAHAEVTTAGQNIWDAKVLINTGVDMEKGKTYKVSYNIATLTALSEGDEFEFILQNGSADSSARYDFANTPTGDNEVEFEVTEETEGSLYILIQMGKLVNELTISKLLVSEVEPTPTPDPAPAAIDFTDKLSGSFDDGAGCTGGVWVDEGDSTIAHAKVETAGSEVWHAKALINTGVAIENGKSYTVSFKLNSYQPWAVKQNFEIILQNGSEDSSAQYQFLSGSVGEYKVGITGTDANAGNLYIRIQMGKVQNEFIISELIVTNEAYTPEVKSYVNFTDKLSGSFDDGAGCTGGAWVDEGDNTIAHIKVETIGDGVWTGKANINTGVAVEEGKTYKVTFTLNPYDPWDESEFEFILQNAGEQRYKFEKNCFGEVELTFTVEEGKGGDLNILIQMGLSQNELILSKLSIVEVTL